MEKNFSYFQKIWVDISLCYQKMKFKITYHQKKGSLKPKKTIFKTPDYSKFILGFDGFEALTFDGNDVYITIEAEQDGMMVGYLAWGSINPNSYEINIGEKNIQKVDTPIQIDNLSFESIINHNKDCC